MLSDFDLEDLEARLYGQVYHASADQISPSFSSPVVSTLNVDVPIQVPIVTPQPTLSNRKNCKPRYYEAITPITSSESRSKSQSENNDEQAFFIHKSGDVNLIHQKKTIPAESRPCLNNITVNQYTYSPLVVNPKTPPRPYKYFESWLKGNQLYKKSAKRINQKRKQAQRLSKKLQTQIILVSDESDCEVEVVSQENNSKINNDKGTAKTPNYEIEDDDDDPEAIVYIEPPPVPLVTLDSDEENEDKKDGNSLNNVDCNTPVKNTTTEAVNIAKSPELLDTPESTNDFLDQSGIEVNCQQKFNFSLHGTDFCQTNNEFVKPANPDPCETESSCSTSDCTRDFNNSLKTIVFNEVEFPKEDLFSEQNLETFGTFITPKRVPAKRSSSDLRNEKPSKKNKTQVGNDKAISDQSSGSDSDYEFAEDKTPHILKKLPILSTIETKECSQETTSETTSDNSLDIRGKNGDKRKKKTKKQITSKGTDIEENQKNNSTKHLASDNTDVEKNMELVEPRVEHKVNSDVEKQKMKLDTPDAKKKKKKQRVDKDQSDMGSDPSKKSVSKIESGNKRKRQDKQKKLKCPQEVSQVQTAVLVETNVDSVSVTLEPSSASFLECNLKFNENGSDNILETKEENNSKSESRREIEPNISLEKDVHLSVNPKNILFVDTSLSVQNKSDPGTKQSLPTEQCLEGVLEHEQVCKTSSAVISPAEPTEPNLTPALEDPIISDNSCGSQFIVVDDKSVNSSDSDKDFRDLTDIGFNIELANTVSAATSSKIHESSEVNFEPFNLEALWCKMSDDPEKWKISPKDRLGPATNMQRGPKCKRCRHVGHLTNNCPNKPALPTCSLCGNPGHQEPRCPNRICFQCGNPGKYSTLYCWKCARHRKSLCCICKTIGHVVETCPDTWRRYHLTTKLGQIQMLKGPQLKPRSQQWCSGCAQQGHLEHECNSYYYHREYPAVAPYVHDYQDLYNYSGSDNLQNSSTQKINPAHFSQIEPVVDVDILPGAIESDQNKPHNLHNVENFVEESSSPQIPSLLTESTVINPFSVMHNPGSSGTVDPKPDTVRIYNHLKGKTHNVFRSAAAKYLRKYVSQEIQRLDDLKLNARILHKQNSVFHRKIMKLTLMQAKPYKRLSREITQFYRKANMFLFGKYQLHEGRKHLDSLKRFVDGSLKKPLTTKRRQSLENAYNYIFGGDVHDNVVYTKMLKVVIYKTKNHPEKA